MTNWKTSIALAAALSTAMIALPRHAEDAAEPAPAAKAKAQLVKVAGKLVLPEELPAKVKAEDVDFSKLSGTIVFEVPRVEPPLPDNFEQMTDDQKQEWITAFRQSPEFQAYMQKARAQMIEQRKQKPVNLVFAEDGSFTAEVAKPGNYILRASIPHPEVKRFMLAEIGDRVEVKADAPAVDFGDLALTVNSVLVPGDMAPGFTAKAYDGAEVKLADFRGKYVLLDFWATWCGPCIAEMPNLKQVYADYGGEKFEIVSLSLDKTIDLPKKFHEEKPSAYTNLYLGEWNKTETTAKAYGVRGIPSIWLIGPDGKIVARDLRGNELREAVKKAVAGEVRTN